MDPFQWWFLPVVQVTKAVLRTDFRDWFSMDSGAVEKAASGTEQREGMSEEEMVAFGKGAMRSHRRLLEECAGSQGRMPGSNGNKKRGSRIGLDSA